MVRYMAQAPNAPAQDFHGMSLKGNSPQNNK